MPIDHRNWLIRLLAALLPGAGTALAIMAIVGRLTGATNDPRTLAAQSLMWLTVFLWLSLIGSCFLFRNGLRAWVVLCASCATLWGIDTLMNVLPA